MYRGVKMYRSLLKECTKRKDLVQAKRVHAHLMQNGFELAKFLGEDLVSTLVHCGSIQDALQVFHKLPKRTVFSWTAVISGYANAGLGQEALRIYRRMQEEGVAPNAYTFVSLLKACGTTADLEGGKRIHTEAFKYKCETNLFVVTSLVDMYGKCGSIVDAQHVFDGLSRRDVVSWNAILAAHVENSQAEKALQLYEQMQYEGINPSSRTFLSILQACGMLAEKEGNVVANGRSHRTQALERGQAIHADVCRKGYDRDVFVCTALVSMYAKCGSMVNAQNVFAGLCKHDVVVWNVMLAAYVDQGQAEKVFLLYEELWEEGLSPNDRTFVSILQACGILAEKEEGVMVDVRFTKFKSLQKGKAIHACVCAKGYESDAFVSSTLVSMYGKCRSVVDAYHVLDGFSHESVVSWNAMLVAYVEQGQAENALQLYERMVEKDLAPNARTIVSVLQACCRLAEKDDFTVLVDDRSLNAKLLERGKAIHAVAHGKGYISDVFVSNTLLCLYGTCGSFEDAQVVFDGLSAPNVVSWTAMLAACVEQGKGVEALQLYRQMQEEDVSPDAWTFVSVLQACSILAEEEVEALVDGRFAKVKSLEMGKVIHAAICKKDCKRDGFITSILIAVYGKCGCIEDAQSVFDELAQQDLVAWTALLRANVEQGQAEMALQLFRKMQHEGVSPNEVTLSCILQACSKTGSLDILRQLHYTLVPDAISSSRLLANALISAYGRCASVGDAQSVFDALPQADVVSWSALIAAYARQGDCTGSMHCFEKMQLANIKPDRITFLSLLSACSHAGLLDKGVQYFESMSRDHGITPDIDHYVSMVDLLGRAGCFAAVEELLLAMPIEPNLNFWLCLMGACRKQGEVGMARKAFDCAVHLHPRHAAAYVLMSNIYAEAGLLDLQKEMNELRQKRSAWKDPGQAWVGHGQEVHSFVVDDDKHPQREQLYQLLRNVCPESEPLGQNTLRER